jgi:transposase
VSDDEWAFVAPYPALLKEDAKQRRYPPREVFNGLRYIVKTGGQWRWMPRDLPPWPAVYQQAQRWLAAGCFETIVHDLRIIPRLAEGRRPHPSAAIFDSQTLQSVPESGAHAGYDGAKRKRGSKVHLAVDTLGHLLALYATPADARDRAQVAELAAPVQAATDEHIQLAFVDQGYAGRSRPRTPPPTASAWRWSSCRRPSAASCCCPGAGSWSAPSPGRCASAAWCATTSAACPSWPACTSSPSLASNSTAPLPSCRRSLVNNKL